MKFEKLFDIEFQLYSVMQAFNQTSKHFNIENFEFLKNRILKVSKILTIQFTNFFLNQVYQTIRTDEFKIVALTVCITLIFNMIFWCFISSPKRDIERLEDEIENLKSENENRTEEIETALVKKIEDRIENVEMRALEEIEEALENINMDSINNNMEILFEDIETLNNSISNIKKENSKLFSLRKSVMDLKKEVDTIKFLWPIEDEKEVDDSDDSDYEEPATKKRKIRDVTEPISISTYNDKSFGVFGNTKKFKDDLKKLGGKWNSNLNGKKGWIFSNKKKTNVEEWFNNLKTVKKQDS